MKKILVTGSSGAVGRTVCKVLSKHGYAVVGLDRVSSPDCSETHIADMADFKSVIEVLDGIDAVVHLAAKPNDADFMTEILPNNIIATYNLLEACRQKNIKKLVLASTMQVLAKISPESGPSSKVSDGTAPTNFYSLSKVFLEGIANLYAVRHKMSITAVRIGWFARTSQEFERIGTSRAAEDMYLSRGDCGQFFLKALESPNPAPGFLLILFATSRPKNGPGADLLTAKESIGYEPMHVWPEGLEI